MRSLALGALLALVAATPPAYAQVPAKIARIGFLTPAPQVQRERIFREALANLGWVEGRNVAIEYRSANGSLDKLPRLAEELAGARVDVIVAFVTQASVAAKNATKTIPIVMVGVADPLGAKLVPSLARPGSNITGNSLASVELIGKQLELLRELRPGVSRVAVLSNPTNPVFNAQQIGEAKAVAARLGVTLTFVEARRPDAIEPAFRSMAAARAEGLLILADPMFGAQVDIIARHALEHRLPSVGPFDHYAEGGALVSYGADFDEAFRRAAVYVDRILKGANPAELPVELPTRYELVFNEKTARTLGVALPPALVSRADRVIR
jgi:putative ABC transport system substrate-binding protein